MPEKKDHNCWSYKPDEEEDHRPVPPPPPIVHPSEDHAFGAWNSDEGNEDYEDHIFGA
jgi:hypothetical protein